MSISFMSSCSCAMQSLAELVLAFFLLGEAADLALVLLRLLMEDLAPAGVDHVGDHVLGRFAEDLARLDAALACG